MMLPLLHQGMVIVGIPSKERALTETTSGGTPYGPSCLSGRDREMSVEEKQLCRALGMRLAKMALALKGVDQ